MKDEVGEMVTAGIEAVKLIIEHERQARYRVPKVVGMDFTKRPAKSVQCDSGLNMTILCNINVIIEIDEVVLIHLPENSKGYKSKNQINNQFLSVGTDIYIIEHSNLPPMFLPHVELKFSHF